MSQINKLKGACTGHFVTQKGNTNGGKLMTYMNFTTGHEVTIGSRSDQLRLPNGVWCSEAALTYKWVLSRPGAGPKAPVCVKFPEGRTNYIFIFS